MKPEDIRKQAETYRPSISDLADKLVKGPLHDMFFPKTEDVMRENFAASMAQDAIRKAMRK